MNCQMDICQTDNGQTNSCQPGNGQSNQRAKALQTEPT